VVSQLGDVMRPIEQFAIGLRIRNSMSGAIGCDKPDPQICEDGLIGWMFQTGSTGAIEMKDRFAFQIAILCIAQGSAILEKDGFIIYVQVHNQLLIWKKKSRVLVNRSVQNKGSLNYSHTWHFCRRYKSFSL
jgi:hypothetical protein